jgi:hypothetical protein
LCEEGVSFQGFLRQVSFKTDSKIVDEKQKSSLVVEKQRDQFSICNEDCATAKKSCDNLLDEGIDQEGVLSLLRSMKSVSSDEFKNKFCQKLSKKCPSKYLPVGYKRVDVPFKAMTNEEIERERNYYVFKASNVGLEVSFTVAKDVNGAMLYWHRRTGMNEPTHTDILVGPLTYGTKTSQDTYLGHEFVIKINDKVVMKYEITISPFQDYIFHWDKVGIKSEKAKSDPSTDL